MLNKKTIAFIAGFTVSVVGLVKLYDLVGHKALYWLTLKADEFTLRRAYAESMVELKR